MAIIGKIRSYGGLIVIIVGIALAAFVLGDFVRKKPKESKNLGEIAGEKITYRDFETKVEEQSELLKQQTGKENLTAAQVFQIREEVWKNEVRDIILGIEYDELGLYISSEELWDLVQGKEPHQYILQNFTDPQTGQFNAAQVRTFLQNLDQYEQQKPGTKAQWQSLEESIKSDRIYNKYLNLVIGGYYLPKALLQKDYDQKNKKAVIRFFADKYSNIADNNVTASQEDFQKYYDVHKQEYEQEASRDMEYVVFDVNPSETDLKKADEDVKQILDNFGKQEDKDISTFVNRYSDDKYDSMYYKKGALPLLLDTLVFKSKKGDIIGPFFNDYTYTLARVMDFKIRPDSLKASHILISYKGSLKAAETITRTEDQAKTTADSILAVIKKNPKKFDTIANTLSDDPTAKTKAGDLDWFADGAMVGPFNEACIQGKEGDIKVVETDFGYHVIKITGKKKLENKARVAVITKKIEPSNETYQTIYSQASAFAGENTTYEQFTKSVVDKKYTKKIAESLLPMSDVIAGLDAPREIIRWAYDETTKKGDVSKVFDLQGKYVVACLKEIREKGTPTLDQVKTQMEPYVKREKKAETIIKKINALKTAGISIEQLAEKDNSSVDTLDFITFSTYSIPGYGPEPEIIGTLFTMKKGTMSEPLKGKTGVFVIYVDNFIESTATTDYTVTKSQLIANFKSRVGYELYTTLEKNAKIVDNRILFY
jgi:peptidyl-prolyl cis-trans isomerase D